MLFKTRACIQVDIVLVWLVSIDKTELLWTTVKNIINQCNKQVIDRLWQLQTPSLGMWLLAMFYHTVVTNVLSIQEHYASGEGN